MKATYSAPHQVNFFFLPEDYDKDLGFGLGRCQGKGWDQVSNPNTYPNPYPFSGPNPKAKKEVNFSKAMNKSP